MSPFAAASRRPRRSGSIPNTTVLTGPHGAFAVVENWRRARWPSTRARSARRFAAFAGSSCRRATRASSLRMSTCTSSTRTTARATMLTTSCAFDGRNACRHAGIHRRIPARRTVAHATRAGVRGRHDARATARVERRSPTGKERRSAGRTGRQILSTMPFDPAQRTGTAARRAARSTKRVQAGTAFANRGAATTPPPHTRATSS